MQDEQGQAGARSSDDALAAARTSTHRREWRDAFGAYSAADRRAPLPATDLEPLATAASMLNRGDDARRALERAYAAHLDDDDPAGAVRCAFWLAIGLLSVGERDRARGWIERAGRLLDRWGGDRVERGYQLVPRVLVDDRERDGDLDGALADATSITEIGERFADPDLVAFGLYAQGRARIRQGRITHGLALLDEAMVAVLADELASPLLTGLIYCLGIALCEELFEVRRTREWTSALGRWCELQPQMVNFTGTCLVHRAGSLQLHGAWPGALDEARRACGRFAPGEPAIGAARYREGEIHRLRGEFGAAEEAFRDASARGWQPQPGLALLWLVTGRTENAVAAIRRVLAETTDRLGRAGMLPAAVEIMLGTGALAAARAAADELGGIAADHGSTALRAMAAYSCGAVELADGGAPPALVPLRSACRLWQEIDAPYEVARARTLIGRACRDLGDEDSASWEFGAARDGFARLGAAPDVARLDALIAAAPGRGACGLSPRELQVLALVAAGRSNRAIAGELVLSERTVDRHVSNILTKLGVRSRTAAAAFAYSHHLL